MIQGFQLLCRVANGEVITPSPDHQVQVVDDLRHGNPLAAVPSELTDLAPNRFHCFLPRPEVRQHFARPSVGSLMKVEPQELETFPAQVHQASLGGVQRQFQFLHDLPNHLQCSFCSCLAAADDHKVIGVTKESFLVPQTVSSSTYPKHADKYSPSTG